MTKEEILDKREAGNDAGVYSDPQIYIAMDEFAKATSLAFDIWKQKNGWQMLSEDGYVRFEWGGEAGFNRKTQTHNELYNQFIEQQNKP